MTTDLKVRMPDVRLYEVSLACNGCQHIERGEYLIRVDDPREVRVTYALRWLVREKGWHWDERGAFCPGCVANFCDKCRHAL